MALFTRHRLLGAVLLMVLLAGAWVGLTSVLSPEWNLRLAYLAMYATALVGMVVLVGQSAQVSLGNGAFMGVGGYVFILSAVNLGLNPIVATILAGLSGVVIGLIVGVIAARLSGPYLAGFTLAVAASLPALANRFTNVLGGESGLLYDGGYPPERLGLDFQLERWQAWLAGSVAIVTCTFVALLATGRIGRSFQAVRDNEPAAALAGIKPSRSKVLAFTVSAVPAALAGAVLVQVITIAAPSAYGIGLSLALLVGVIVGGRHSIVGAVLGATVLALLPDVTEIVVERMALPEQVALGLGDFLYGVILLIAVAFAPRGLAGLLRRGHA